MPFPCEPVGSLPRSSALQQAYADFDKGKISSEEWQTAQEEACRDTLLRQEQIGAELLTDGEQRKAAFAVYPFTETLGGHGMRGFGRAARIFAFFSDGHSRALPQLNEGPFRYNRYAGSYVAAARSLTAKPLKQAVIGPAFLSLLYPDGEAIPGYSRAQFLNDVCDEAERDIRSAFAAGAARVSIDFTEGRLACKKDARVPWTGEARLTEFLQLTANVIDRFSPQDRARLGIHVCPGGDCDSDHSAETDPTELLERIFALNAGYFLIRFSGEPYKREIASLLGTCRREDAAGIPQHVYLGVTDPVNPRVESPEEVAETLALAAEYLPPERLGVTDDCGFSPFSADPKPRHGSPDAAREIAFAKIEARLKGASLAAARLGI